jgi:hypothetical protein
MGERDGVTVWRLNRDTLATYRHDAGERDDPGRGRQNRRPRRGPDVDAAVLRGSIGVVAESELLQHRSFDRPRPGSDVWGRGQGDCHDRRQDSEPHPRWLLVV